MTVQEMPSCSDEPKVEKEKTVGKKFKDSGVKKLVILGLVENGLETYHNIEVLMQKVGVNTLSFAKSMSVDLKMVNLLIGKKISHFYFFAIQIKYLNFSVSNHLHQL